MLKKILLMTGVLIFMLALGLETAHAQVGLDDAIRNATERLAPQLGREARVAVFYIGAGSVRMSDHIRNRMHAALGNRFTMVAVEESVLEIIRAEQDRQMGERFDTAAFVGITGGLGAQFVVVGSFQPILNFHDFRVQIIDAGTNVVVGSFETHVQDNRLIRDLLGADFTTAQRWGTVGLNLVPGVGSLAIMRDIPGGIIQLVGGGAGWGLLFFGIATTYTEQGWDPILERPTTLERNNRWAIFAGGGLIALQNIYSIWRAYNFTARPARMSSIVDPEAWNLAIIPGRNGIEGVSLSHTVRFSVCR